MTTQRTVYQIDYTQRPPSILPDGISTSGFIDVTTIGSPWKKYLDPQSGKVHDGVEYAKQVGRDFAEILSGKS